MERDDDPLSDLRLTLDGVDKIPADLNPNLTFLNVSGNQLKEIKNLENLTNLTTLCLANHFITELKGLDHNVKVASLIMDLNPIRALKAEHLSHLTNLRYLSLNGSLVSNLWTTVGALKSLTNLAHLCFGADNRVLSAEDELFPDGENPNMEDSEEEENSLMSDINDIEALLDIDNSDSDNNTELSEDNLSEADLERWIQLRANYGQIHQQRHYREFIIHHLPQLLSLDHKEITVEERAQSAEICQKYFVLDPFKEKSFKKPISNTNITSMLKECQLGLLDASTISIRAYQNSYQHYSQPKITRMCSKFRPRQVEYNPTLPGLLLFGTINAEIGVLNYERNKVLATTSVEGNRGTVLGLCWLKSQPLKFVAGCDSGHINLFDVNDIIQSKGPSHQYKKFPRLTSISVNSTDELLLTSGYSHNVFVHDLSSSREVRTYTECHTNYINSAKFANSIPYLFTTSSFDKTLKLFDIRDRSESPIYVRENKNECMMVTWSPDDRFLLVSCVDNEVTQFNAVDGAVHLRYPLMPIGSEYNYTRSYFINHGDYIIVGSCEQGAIRICSAKDGRLLREVNFDADAEKRRLCCQSLRGNPHEDFRFSILVAEIMNYSDLKLYDVNLLRGEYD